MATNFFTRNLIERCHKKGYSVRDRHLKMKPIEQLNRMCSAEAATRGVNTQALQLGLKPLYDRAYDIYTKKSISKAKAIEAAKKMADGIEVSRKLMLTTSRPSSVRSSPAKSRPSSVRSSPAKSRPSSMRSSPAKSPVRSSPAKSRPSPVRSSPAKGSVRPRPRAAFNLEATCDDVALCAATRKGRNVRTSRAQMIPARKPRVPSLNPYMKSSGRTPPKINFDRWVADPSLRMPHSNVYRYTALSPKRTSVAFLNNLTQDMYVPSVRGQEKNKPKVLYNNTNVYDPEKNINVLTKPKSPVREPVNDKQHKLMKQFARYSNMQNALRNAVRKSKLPGGSGVLRRKK
jgi:hypothetical protein